MAAHGWNIAIIRVRKSVPDTIQHARVLGGTAGAPTSWQLRVHGAPRRAWLATAGKFSHYAAAAARPHLSVLLLARLCAMLARREASSSRMLGLTASPQMLGCAQRRTARVALVKSSGRTTSLPRYWGPTATRGLWSAGHGSGSPYFGVAATRLSSIPSPHTAHIIRALSSHPHTTPVLHAFMRAWQQFPCALPLLSSPHQGARHKCTTSLATMLLQHAHSQASHLTCKGQLCAPSSQQHSHFNPHAHTE